KLHTGLGHIDTGGGEGAAFRRNRRQFLLNSGDLRVIDLQELREGHGSQVLDGNRRSYREQGPTGTEIDNPVEDVGESLPAERRPAVPHWSNERRLTQLVVSRRAISIDPASTANDGLVVLPRAPGESD